MSAVISLTEAPAARLEAQRGPAPPDATLDLLVGVVGLWLAAGFLWDSWAHLHVAIETFLAKPSFSAGASTHWPVQSYFQP